MGNILDLNAVCAPSEDVVTREIEGEVLIIPVVAGIGDKDDELYTLSETGQAIWLKLDGRRTLREIAGLLAAEFEGSAEEIEKHVVGFATELARRGLIVAR